VFGRRLAAQRRSSMRNTQGCADERRCQQLSNQVELFESLHIFDRS
jgi:hypothetical protein